MWKIKRIGGILIKLHDAISEFGLGLENFTVTEINYWLQSQGAPDENWWVSTHSLSNEKACRERVCSPTYFLQLETKNNFIS